MLRAFRFSFPPAEEQRSIATYLDEKVASLDGARAAVELQIRAVREYRTRLIADVVTGKLDVRQAAARLPDDPDQPEPVDDTEAEGDAEEVDTADIDGVPEEAQP
jgi:type I restriction enzyme S subunit